MNRGLFSIVMFASLILLAGCTVSVSTPFDPDTVQVSANSDGLQARDSYSLQPNESIWYEVSVSSDLANATDLLYLEAEPQGFSDTSGVLSIRHYSASGTVLASSVSPAGFGSGTSTFTASAKGFAPAVVSAANCRGPCIIEPIEPTTVLVRVQNTSSTSVTASFYAFGDEFGDQNEPGNNSEVGAFPLSVGQSDSGAIETLGDVDWYRVNERGRLHFASLSSADLVAEVWDGNEFLRLLAPGESYSVRAGDEVAVYSASDFAGPPGSDGVGTFYSVDIEAE